MERRSWRRVGRCNRKSSARLAWFACCRKERFYRKCCRLNVRGRILGRSMGKVSSTRMPSHRSARSRSVKEPIARSHPMRSKGSSHTTRVATVKACRSRSNLGCLRPHIRPCCAPAQARAQPRLGFILLRRKRLCNIQRRLNSTLKCNTARTGARLLPVF